MGAVLVCSPFAAAAFILAIRDSETMEPVGVPVPPEQGSFSIAVATHVNTYFVVRINNIAEP